MGDVTCRMGLGSRPTDVWLCIGKDRTVRVITYRYYTNSQLASEMLFFFFFGGGGGGDAAANGLHRTCSLGT